MPLEVIYVARHGFRSNWLVDHATGTYTATLRSPTGGAADPALTSHGVDQARELGERLLKAEPPIERVYSSLYYRCLQTVEPFVRKAIVTDKRLSIRGETGLGEWYGAANFEHPVPASHEILRPLFPGLLDEEYRPLVTPTRMGEGVDELHDRVARTMDELIAQCDREGVRAVLLCSHAATIIALGRVLTGDMPESIDTEDFRAFTCGLSVYRRRASPAGIVSGTVKCHGDGIATSSGASAAHAADRHKDLAWRGGRGVGGGWMCELNSDCTHLSLGEERGWRFSGDESFLGTASGQSMLDAGQLGVVVEGRGGGSTNRGKL